MAFDTANLKRSELSPATESFKTDDKKKGIGQTIKNSFANRIVGFSRNWEQNNMASRSASMIQSGPNVKVESHTRQDQNYLMMKIVEFAKKFECKVVILYDIGSA